MERIQLELKVDGDVIEQMQAASDFVSYINDSLKPQDGKAYEIQTRGLGFLDGSHHILVEIAKVGALPGLILILSTYVKAKLNAKIKIKRGTNSIGVPSDRVSDEQMNELLEFITQSHPKDRDRKKKK